MEGTNEESTTPTTSPTTTSFSITDTITAPPTTSTPTTSVPPYSPLPDAHNTNRDTDTNSEEGVNRDNSNNNSSITALSEASSSSLTTPFSRIKLLSMTQQPLSSLRQALCTALEKLKKAADEKRKYSSSSSNSWRGVWTPADVLDVVIAALFCLSIVLGVLIYWTHACCHIGAANGNGIGIGGSCKLGANGIGIGIGMSGKQQPCERAVVLVTAPLKSWRATYENAGLAFVQQQKITGVVDEHGECRCEDLGDGLGYY